MASEGGEKYVQPPLRLERGDLYGKPRKFERRAAMAFTTAEFDLDRVMHDAFCALEGEDGTVPSRGIQEIRQHRQRPWRFMGRRLREAVNAGATEAQLHEVVHVLHQYVTRLYAKRAKRIA